MSFGIMLSKVKNAELGALFTNSFMASVADMSVAKDSSVIFSSKILRYGVPLFALVKRYAS